MAKIAQQKSGILNQCMPGALSLTTVVMKLIPVSIDEKPSTKAANTAIDTFVPVFRLNGA